MTTNNEITVIEPHFEKCKRLAEQGDANSQWWLGRIYQYGLEDVKQDYVEAFKWYGKAAEQEPFVQYDIGNCYRYGYGVEKDDVKAFKSYKQAAENHNSDAQLCLGNCYYYGYGVEQDYSQAAYWYEQVGGSQGKIIYQWLNCQIKMKNFDLAKQAIAEVYSDAYDSEKDYKDTCLTAIVLAEQLEEKNQQLELEIKEKEKAYRAIHEKEKEMLSFFTHTMRNALATAPESLRQVIHLLGGEVYEKDTKHYQAINKIASLFSTLSLTDCLIDTFKQSISDPQEFKQSWQKDHTGEATLRLVIASSLRQSLNRIIFMSDTSELRKLLDNPETALIKATRKSFIEEVLPLNVDSQGVNVFYAWTLKHISAIDVSIVDCDKLNFGVNQIRFSLLFAITSELILNALKYWDGENRIQISWQLAEQGNYAFSVKNHCKANATSNLAGTHKGLAFIKRLVELLGDQAQFNCKSEDQLFIAELILNKALFDGEV
ncbi:hypothetical protein QZJ86_19695 [Methylomonas montana]|uniref:hypothetical protein n=1 Tax=Methylomonas montana TaxID=3058963 RepID=UPI00265A11E0|nr:hypothetical protein [Methylomonas montana]WKJ90210.1 hypothetical protein QZJ86_19695 [Methylomonas montana]